MSNINSITQELRILSDELLSEEERETLRTIISIWPRSYDMLSKLDNLLGGPGFSNINCRKTGRYHVDDRDIFRPLQYFSMYFDAASKNEENRDWFARDIVQTGGIQLESLVKRVAGVDRLPLGQALANALVKRLLNPIDRQRMQQYSKLYNAAKHKMDQSKDTHLFSFEDAILSYFIVRKLAAILYPLAKMKTDLNIFSQECQESKSEK